MGITFLIFFLGGLSVAWCTSSYGAPDADQTLDVLKQVLQDVIHAEDSPVSTIYRSWFSADTLSFLLKASIRIAMILLFSISLWRFLNYIIQRYAERSPLVNKVTHSSNSTVIKTALPILRSTTQWILIVMTIILILSELRVDITPILLSFSVIGLAFSMGCQSLVKDIINGVMALFEGNMSIGDVVKIGQRTGTVESMSLRCVYLRHSSGHLETIPFSEITSITNLSRDYGVTSVELMVEYNVDLSDIRDAFNSVFQDLYHDPQMRSYIRGELNFGGVEDIDAKGVKVSAFIKTKPDPTKEFKRAFCTRLLEECQKRKIPFAKRLGV